MRKSNSGSFSPYKNVTPQGKLINVSDKFGNSQIKKMQGSTVHKYHYLPLAGTTVPLGAEFRFFEGAGQIAFPFTNLTEGKLQVGEAMVLERMWFDIMVTDTATGNVLRTESLSVGLNGMYAGLMNFQNANSQVIKPMPVLKQKPNFNQKAWSTVNEVIHLDTDITLQPLIEFVSILRSPGALITVVSGESKFIGCHIEGAGAILNPRANY